MAEPVSLATEKQHLRVFDTSEHALIEGFERAARTWVENHTDYILSPQTFVEQFTAWGSYLTLYRRPVTAITTIEYDSADEDQAAFTGFEFATGQYPLLIYPETSWPSLRANGYITVTYTAGFAAGEVPDDLVHAVQVLAAFFFVNRSDAGDIPLAVRALCRPYRKPVMA